MLLQALVHAVHLPLVVILLVLALVLRHVSALLARSTAMTSSGPSVVVRVIDPRRLIEIGKKLLVVVELVQRMQSTIEGSTLGLGSVDPQHRVFGEAAEVLDQLLIVLLEVLTNIEEALALLFPEAYRDLVVALDHLELLSQPFELRHGFHFVFRFLFRFASDFLHFLLVEGCHGPDEVVHVALCLRHAADLALFGLQESQNLAEVHAREHLKFSGFRLELIEPLALRVLVLQQFLLLPPLLLDVVLEPLNDLLLGGNLLLGPLDFLLEDLLSLLALGELLPEGRVRGELLLEVVDLVLMALSREHLFEFGQDSVFSYDVLESEHFGPGLGLVLLQLLQLLEKFWVCWSTSLGHRAIRVDDEVVYIQSRVVDVDLLGLVLCQSLLPPRRLPGVGVSCCLRLHFGVYSIDLCSHSGSDLL